MGGICICGLPAAKQFGRTDRSTLIYILVIKHQHVTDSSCNTRLFRQNFNLRLSSDRECKTLGPL